MRIMVQYLIGSQKEGIMLIREMIKVIQQLLAQNLLAQKLLES